MAPQRLFVPGLSHHVRHRGNNRCDVFLDRRDRETFLSMLAKSAQEHEVALHGYSLMTTHYHTQVTAPHADALPQMMQSLGRSYVRYFNVRHRRTGTLWEGRYQASLILDERHWYNCLRYIELNPVRACMVASPAEYEWSSYRANALGVENTMLTPHALYLELGAIPGDRAINWAAMCQQGMTERELGHIRASIQRGQPLGPEEVRADPKDSRRIRLAVS